MALELQHEGQRYVICEIDGDLVIKNFGLAGESQFRILESALRAAFDRITELEAEATR